MDRRPLPRADTTVEILLLALCERLDEVLGLLTPEPAPPPRSGAGRSSPRDSTPRPSRPAPLPPTPFE